ncbi:endonuclease/exonuclease/phosphatase family protein [Streptomyces sp. NPDC006733]|uniref:endonuclease/exonuclease/phosphatase family protein n=1 Tax=Streptomyces sp. NPDC006733 TaxID=3155460 RepID=UPI0033E0BA8B
MVERADDMVVPESVLPVRWLRRPGRWRWGKDAQGRSTWARGRVLAAVAVSTAGLLAFHSAVPDSVGHPGSLVEAFLPWLGLAVPVILLLALLRRSATALAVLLLPTAVWTQLFGGVLLPRDPGAPDLTVLQHNVSDENADPAGTARALVDAGPQLIALEELTPSALPRFEAALAGAYAYHAVRGTVGLWSKYPLTDARPVDIKPRGITEEWSRGLRAGARTPWGEIAVYVAHLPSVRVRPTGFDCAFRNESAGLLGAALAAETTDRVILLGDLNATVDDRGLAPITAHLTLPPRDLAFSWPAAFPVSRIDQILTRSAAITAIRALPATASDHLPVTAGITFTP